MIFLIQAWHSASVMPRAVTSNWNGVAEACAYSSGVNRPRSCTRSRMRRTYLSQCGYSCPWQYCM